MRCMPWTDNCLTILLAHWLSSRHTDTFSHIPNTEKLPHYIRDPLVTDLTVNYEMILFSKNDITEKCAAIYIFYEKTWDVSVCHLQSLGRGCWRRSAAGGRANRPGAPAARTGASGHTCSSSTGPLLWLPAPRLAPPADPHTPHRNTCTQHSQLSSFILGKTTGWQHFVVDMHYPL